MPSMLYHTLNREEILKELETDVKGISDQEVAKRRETYGPNRQPGRKHVSLFTIILAQFKSPFIYVLLVAMAISFILGEFTDGGFILFVIVLNAGLGAWQEFEAELNARELETFMVPHAVVLRAGQEKDLSSEELVPGDVVKLTSGDKVPADLRLIDTKDLRIDESLLTGESDAVNKVVSVLGDQSLPIAERKNMAYAGSTVVAGRGLGVVVATALGTELGKLSKELTSSSTTDTPLVERMERFSTLLSYIIIGACALFAVISYFQGIELKEIFFIAVALAVSAIPEGLPISMTVALSVSQHRMFKRNVIVRQLTAVEGLGSCTAIATDKTGTLTVNQQTVREICIPNQAIVEVSGEGYNAEGQVSQKPEGWENLLLSFLSSDEGSLEKRENEWFHTGDAMDVALLAMAQKAGTTKEEIDSEITLHELIPYESEKMYSGAIFTHEGIKKAALKGALEKVMEYCPKEELELAEAHFNHLSGKGMRILVGILGDYKGTGDEKELSNYDFHYKGAVGFLDPIRPEVSQAIEKSRAAGVNVYMVTGDHPKTALAIGKELKLATSEEQVITGRELESMTPEELSQVIQKKTVFARVAPLQKLDIVDALIKSGQYVAVTGDGANDAPALKKANIGVAMGSGTDMAKDTSDLIVTNDDFKSILAGIEEGRLAYTNIRKVVFLLVSCGMGEILIFLLSILAGLPIPLSALQILWLNVVTNGIQDKALALEKGSPALMKRKPRDPKEGIFDKHMITQVLTAGITMGLVSFGLYWYCMENGYELAYARNWVLFVMVSLQNVQLINSRSEYGSVLGIPLNRNIWIPLAIIITQGLQIAVMYIPFTQELLGLAPIDTMQWLISLGLALSILVTMEGYKYILKLRGKSVVE